MYLKSLTLRGFKSFASSTTLRFEPGVTCVVGPNGSGKSNIVDAIAWVMGEQGVKSLRGGKMEDVIFAGTAGRAPLGRAEVLLTIDNTDGALPIEYTEVTIGRIMFKGGGSEYSINGSPCRLLDVQELLADSGIGREMHVVVGQGQLDAVLRASAEERRGFVEEAAGVLKHRRRREKAERKLVAAEANLARLRDVLTELRRQLGPLGRQAAVARRAGVIQAQVRDARLRLLADELATLRTARDADAAAEQQLRTRRVAVEEALAAARAEEARLAGVAGGDAEALAAAAELCHRLDRVADRLRGTIALGTDRVRRFAAEPVPEATGRDPDELAGEAGEARVAEGRLAADVAEHEHALAGVVAAREQAEAAAEAEDRRVAGLLRVAADRREGLARLGGQVAAARTRIEARAGEVERLRAAHAEATQRAEAADREYTAVETGIAGLDAGEEGLDADHERATSDLSAVEARLAELAGEERAAERERAALAARCEALELGMARRDGGGALLAASERLSGVLGAVAALVAVEPGYAAAVSVALGAAADAVAVATLDDAVAALAHLKEADLGRAGLLLAEAGPPGGIGSASTGADRAGWPELPAGARYAVDTVTAPAELAASVARLLRKVAVVADLPAARALVGRLPDVVAATRDGDLLGAGVAAGGSGSTSSLLEVQAAAEQARAALEAATHRAQRLRFAVAAATEERQECAARVERTLDRLHASDAELAAVAERLGRLGAAARAARAEAQRLERAIADAAKGRERDAAALAELQARLSAAEAGPEEEPSTAERDRLAGAARAARAAELEARLALRTTEERLRAVAGRAESLERQAAAERAARARLAELRARRARDTAVAQAVVRVGTELLGRLAASARAAQADRAAAATRRDEREQALARARQAAGDRAAELAVLTDDVHRGELAGAERRLRIEAAEERAVAELGIDPAELLAGYGPDQPVPVLPSGDDAGAAGGAGAGRGDGGGGAGAARRGSVGGADEAESAGRGDGNGGAGEAESAGDTGARRDGGAGRSGRDGAVRSDADRGSRDGDVGGGEVRDGGAGAAAADRDGDPDRPAGRTVPFVRAEQEKRLRRAERELAQLGRVNPLALEEFAALEERNQFLTEQLRDLEKTRRDLLDIIGEVDERVRQVFAEAYADTAAQFARIFDRLFPGGEGRLVLTDPDDLLATGVEVEARPPGKKIKRLSLLSGGERSLVAVAFLVALFCARPSPFYVLDEVEAALDDVNLGRVLALYEELRESSQLLVVTHQKRTMEVADALYGITMRGDGVSTVISQRLREALSA